MERTTGANKPVGKEQALAKAYDAFVFGRLSNVDALKVLVDLNDRNMDTAWAILGAWLKDRRKMGWQEK
jgi:hypothetical protein